jgi:hypothetical protein
MTRNHDESSTEGIHQLDHSNMGVYVCGIHDAIKVQCLQTDVHFVAELFQLGIHKRASRSSWYKMDNQMQQSAESAGISGITRTSSNMKPRNIYKISAKSYRVADVLHGFDGCIVECLRQLVSFPFRLRIFVAAFHLRLRSSATTSKRCHILSYSTIAAVKPSHQGNLLQC